MTVTRYDPASLRNFCGDILVRLGVPEEGAAFVADSLVRANLEGSDSHGISRLGIYVRRLEEGRISARPEIRIERSGSVLRVDGDNGLGQVVSRRSLKEAVPVARETGIAGVGVRNSNHFGTAAYYCQMVCREGMALIATTNTPPGIAPWGGKKAYFGTNPIAFGFPTKEGPPVIVDMSSSVVARGKIILADKEGTEIPEGWAIDEEGKETTDPASALKGAMLPLGGAKGYALALAVEMMSGVLSGSSFGPHVGSIYTDGDPPSNVGHSFILLDVSRWLPAEDYYARVDQLLAEVKAVPPAGETEVLYPGERRYRTFLENSERGITLPLAVREELEMLAREYGVAWP